MIHYYYVLYNRINECFLKDNRYSISKKKTKHIGEARKYMTENRANAIKKKLANPSNWTTHKVSASLDVDINPTEEEYALWMGGCRIEAYIAYKTRTGLGVNDIIEIFRSVFKCDINIQYILEITKGIK